MRVRALADTVDRANSLTAASGVSPTGGDGDAAQTDEKAPSPIRLSNFQFRSSDVFRPTTKSSASAMGMRISPTLRVTDSGICLLSRFSCWDSRRVMDGAAEKGVRDDVVEGGSLGRGALLTILPGDGSARGNVMLRRPARLKSIAGGGDMVVMNGTPFAGDLVGVLTDLSPLLAHVEGTPLPILPSLANGFGGVGRLTVEPKNRSFLELELRAGLMAPSLFGVDCRTSLSRRLSRPSEGALGGCRRIGEGRGDGPFRSHGRS